MNVNGSQKLVYSSNEGTTNYTGDNTPTTGGGRGLTVGNTSSGTLEITGGTLSTLSAASADVIGNGNNSTGILTINGGDFIGTNAGTFLGIGTGTGRVSTLNVQSGSATLATLTINSTAATINLSGTGVLAVNNITKTSGTANINFNGGTLKARTSTTTFLTGLNTATVNASGVTVDSNSFNITIGQALLAGSGSGGLTKSGAGKLMLSQNNSYSGTTTVSAGAIIKTAADSTSGNISVTNGATYVLSGGVSDGSGQTITLNGPGSNTADYFYTGSAAQRGALQAQSGSNTWQGNIVITGTSNTRIGVQDGASLTITGNMTENTAGSSLAIRAGNAGSDVVLSGVGSWTGLTTYFSTGGAIRITGNDRVSTSSTAYFSATGSTVFDLNSYNQKFAGVYSDGDSTSANITNKATDTNAVLTSDTAESTNYNYKGKISDGLGTVSLIKTGVGTQILSGANTYTGTTTVSSGILSINGSLANTATTVQSGGTLRGAGTISGSVTIENGGTIAAGNSIESLKTGALTLNAGSTFSYEINKDAADNVAGDLTAVTGNLSIDLTNSAILSLAELGTGNGIWNLGNKLTLLSYSGTWNGGRFSYGGNTLADDSTITFSGMDWLFNYNDTAAGSNYTSDLTGSSFVTITAVPETSATLLSVLGLLPLMRRRRN